RGSLLLSSSIGVGLCGRLAHRTGHPAVNLTQPPSLEMREDFGRLLLLAFWGQRDRVGALDSWRWARWTRMNRSNRLRPAVLRTTVRRTPLAMPRPFSFSDIFRANA